MVTFIFSHRVKLRHKDNNWGWQWKASSLFKNETIVYTNPIFPAAIHQTRLFLSRAPSTYFPQPHANHALTTSMNQPSAPHPYTKHAFSATAHQPRICRSLDRWTWRRSARRGARSCGPASPCDAFSRPLRSGTWPYSRPTWTRPAAGAWPRSSPERRYRRTKLSRNTSPREKLKKKKHRLRNIKARHALLTILYYQQSLGTMAGRLEVSSQTLVSSDQSVELQSRKLI